jgi:hypothetical protein
MNKKHLLIIFTSLIIIISLIDVYFILKLKDFILLLIIIINLTLTVSILRLTHIVFHRLDKLKNKFLFLTLISINVISLMLLVFYNHNTFILKAFYYMFYNDFPVTFRHQEIFPLNILTYYIPFLITPILTYFITKRKNTNHNT